MWYMEYRDFKYGTNTTNEIRKIGHYTQVVWATTHLVGCGVSHCTGGKGPLGEDFYMYVCNYAPRYVPIRIHTRACYYLTFCMYHRASRSSVAFFS